MYYIWMLGLQFILLTLPNVYGLGNVEQSPEEKQEEERKAANCWDGSVSTEKYPFFASVVYKCNEDLPFFGVIISADYVLASTDYPAKFNNSCVPIVYVGSDEQGNGGSKHDAELTRIGYLEKLSLLKLKSPIKFGPRAQPVKMVEANEGPKSKDTVTLLALQRQPPTSTKSKVYANNFTVMSVEECEELMSRRFLNDRRHCKNTVSALIDKKQFACPVEGKSVLMVNDRLAAIENWDGAKNLDSGKVLHRFSDIGYDRASIKNHTGI